MYIIYYVNYFINFDKVRGKGRKYDKTQMDENMHNDNDVNVFRWLFFAGGVTLC